MRQIEQMESEELLAQKKLRTEVIQLEDMLAQVRKEYEMLRIEFEQNLAANEQTGKRKKMGQMPPTTSLLPKNTTLLYILLNTLCLLYTSDAADE